MHNEYAQSSQYKMEPEQNNTVINFRQFMPANKLQFIEPILVKLSKLAQENHVGIISLEIVVLMCVILLGLTILMVIKQEVWGPSVADEPLPRPAPPMSA